MTDELSAREADEEREHPQLYEVKDMSQLIDLQSLGGAGGEGGSMGFGGTAMGLVLGLLLGGNRNGGLLGGNGDGGSAVNQITLGQIQTALGDIKASVPLAEGQVQLALAGTQAELSSQNTANTMSLINQGNQNMLSNCQSFAATGDKIDAMSAATALGLGGLNAAIERSNFALSQIINADGQATRGLITSNQIGDLNRLAAERQDEIIELRNGAARDRDRHGIEITMTNNQNQNQMQFQQQAQIMGTLANVLSEVGQLARATNTNLIVGNAGATTTGAMTANPVNVRA